MWHNKLGKKSVQRDLGLLLMMGSMVLRVFIICSEFFVVQCVFVACMMILSAIFHLSRTKNCFTQFFGGSRYKACMFWAVGNWDGLLDKTFISTIIGRVER